MAVSECRFAGGPLDGLVLQVPHEKNSPPAAIYGRAGASGAEVVATADPVLLRQLGNEDGWRAYDYAPDPIRLELNTPLPFRCRPTNA
jgi:hypothetical protein